MVIETSKKKKKCLNKLDCFNFFLKYIYYFHIQMYVRKHFYFLVIIFALLNRKKEMNQEKSSRQIVIKVKKDRLL